MRSPSTIRTLLCISLNIALAGGLVVACQGGDDEPDAECGNGIHESGELCDGQELGGVTCASLGLGTGEITCNDQCHPVLSGCTQAPECGNDMREPGEVCDGSDLGGLSCGDLGFDGGTAACRTDCDFDLASCCSNDCPMDGDTRCDTDVVQTCSTQANGCLGWADTTDCAQNNPAQVCDASAIDAVCVDPCQNGCPTEGEEQCDADVIETCLPTATGCLDWVPLFDCATNVPAQTCDATGGAAVCIAECQSDCTATDRMQCTGDNLESCVEVTPGCYQWNLVQDCTIYTCGVCYEDSWDAGMAYCTAGC